jgi:orotate phosphoribosyltransferase
MSSITQSRIDLLQLLRGKSVFRGEFTLSSGATSSYYIDCRMTTTDPRGAWLVGVVLHDLIRHEEKRRGCVLDAIGGLTMGADPVAFAVGMISVHAQDSRPLRMFVVRKAAKSHGQTKLIEGNFHTGDRVVVVDDVITRGDSILKAVEAVRAEGGTVAFVAVLVDRQEGGCERLKLAGVDVLAVFTRDDLLESSDSEPAATRIGDPGLAAAT